MIWIILILFEKNLVLHHSCIYVQYLPICRYTYQWINVLLRYIFLHLYGRYRYHFMQVGKYMKKIPFPIFMLETKLVGILNWRLSKAKLKGFFVSLVTFQLGLSSSSATAHQPNKGGNTTGNWVLPRVPLLLLSSRLVYFPHIMGVVVGLL